MDDQRKEPRTHLIYYLRVFDRNTHALFGHVVDISQSGMLITSDKPMKSRSLYQLEVEDVSSIDRLTTIDMDAECRWSQEDDIAGLFDGGFQFIEPSRQLDSLLTSYA